MPVDGLQIDALLDRTQIVEPGKRGRLGVIGGERYKDLPLLQRDAFQ